MNLTEIRNLVRIGSQEEYCCLEYVDVSVGRTLSIFRVEKVAKQAK
jgi:hypothetical protein